jgi:hypothetical protein
MRHLSAFSAVETCLFASTKLESVTNVINVLTK